MIQLCIYGETPSKKNSRVFLKNGRNIPSERYRAWHMTALLQLSAQLQDLGIENELIDHPVSVTLRFYHADKRRRDSDNGTSSILDLLQDGQLLKDDCWEIVQHLSVHNYYDKGCARCEIVIEDYR